MTFPQKFIPHKPNPNRKVSSMKTAKKVVVSIELTCPHCEEPIPQTNSGSLFWMVCELPATGTPLTCPYCCKQSKTPRA